MCCAQVAPRCRLFHLTRPATTVSHQLPRVKPLGKALQKKPRVQGLPLICLQSSLKGTGRLEVANSH